MPHSGTVAARASRLGRPLTQEVMKDRRRLGLPIVPLPAWLDHQRSYEASIAAMQHLNTVPAQLLQKLGLDPGNFS